MFLGLHLCRIVFLGISLLVLGLDSFQILSDGESSATKYVPEILEHQNTILAQILDSLTQESRCPREELTHDLMEDLKNFWVIKEQVKHAGLTLAELIVQVQNLEESKRYWEMDSKVLTRTMEHLKLDVRSLMKTRERQQKKQPVMFDASRSTDFPILGNLTFTKCDINVGNGFNLSDGSFKAPLSGIYTFSFHANTMTGKDGLVLLKRNGETVAGMFDTDNYNHNGLAQSVLVTLEAEDLLWIEILSGGVRSNENVYVHFVGWLVD